MKTVLNKVKMSVIAASLLASCISQAVESSGEGRNGPDKNGVSIPASMDQRLITLERFTRSKEHCDNVQHKKLLSQLIRIPYEEVSGYDVAFRHAALVSPSNQVLYVDFVNRDKNNSALPPWMSFLKPEQNTYFYQYIQIRKSTLDALEKQTNVFDYGTTQHIDQARFNLVLAMLKNRTEAEWKFKIDLQHTLKIQSVSYNDSINYCDEYGCTPEIFSKFYKNTLVKSFEVNGSGLLITEKNKNDFPGLAGLNGSEFYQCMQDHMQDDMIQVP